MKNIFLLLKVRLVKTLLLLLVFLIHASVGYSQSSQTDVAKLTPQSPEAANLGRYGEVAVGEYTGAVNISIPLHIIKSGSLSFPLDLYYNSTGVKVSQDATWVGLNWDLTAMAGITYTPAGGNDQMYPAYSMAIPWADWRALMDVINPQEIAPILNETLEPLYPYNSLCFGAAVSGASERDLYSVNAPGLSFKFYIHPGTGLPEIIGERNNCKITGSPNANGFTIVNGQGITYLFSTPEQDGQSMGIYNAWYLTGISNSDGDWIRFTYANYGPTVVLPPISENSLDVIEANSASISPPPGGRTAFAEIKVINTKYLTGIESLTETVSFQLSTRDDIAGAGARKLDSLIVEDKYSARKRIFEFQYGYFDGSSSIGGNYLTDGTTTGMGAMTEAYLRKRLKLISVQERNTSGTETTEQRTTSRAETTNRHSFTYNESQLPMKTSFAVDHWGYFNGEENFSTLVNQAGSQRTLIPNYYSLIFYDNSLNNSKILHTNIYEGARRGSRSGYMLRGSLRSITYPTGGKSEFTFEPHSFNNVNVLAADDEISGSNIETISLIDLNYPDGSNDALSHAEFDITETQVVNIWGNFQNRRLDGTLFTYDQMKGASITLLKVNPPGIDVLRNWKPVVFNDNTYSAQPINESITLTPAKYILVVNAPNDLGFQGYTGLVVAGLKFIKIPVIITPTTFTSIGGGLRIKSINNFDENNNKVSSREYSYTNIDGTTSGKLQTPLQYVESKYYYDYMWAETAIDGQIQFACDGVIDCRAQYRNCHNVFSLSTNPVKAVVGYSRVVIKDYNEDHTKNNGTLIKEFYNNLSSYKFWKGIIINNIDLTGELLSSIDLNEAGDTVYVEKNEYSLADIETDWVNVTGTNNALPGVFQGTNNPGVPYWACGHPQYSLASYPYVRYITFPSQKTQIFFSGSNKDTIQTDYTYNLSNYAISEVKTYNSKKELNTTRYKYPVDFVSENQIYGSMINDNNLIEPVIEETKLKNNVQLTRTKTNYWVMDGLIKPYSVEQQVMDNPVQTMLNLDRYMGGNIAQYRAKDGINNTFIWAYHNTLPIAKVGNAKLSDVYYTGFEDTDTDVVTGDGKTGLKSKINGFVKQLTGLTNGSYTLSFWQKASGKWVLNVQPVAVTNGSYTITIPSTATVDDVRFMPADAVMTTYSYNAFGKLASVTDQNHLTSFFEFDDFNRLHLLRDDDNNILRVYNYHQNPDATVSDHNYVATTRIQKEGTTNESQVSTLEVGDKLLDYGYFDGLGRSLQTISVQQSPDKKDIVQPFAYDDFGRETIKYLPYVSVEGNGSFKTNSIGLQLQFYQNADHVAHDANPYSETVFESSPLNRVIEQGAPGSSWQPDNTDSYTSTDHTVKHDYAFNGANDVILFAYDATTGEVSAGGSVINYYDANQLQANKTKDEHGNEVIEYIDREGHTVCKKVQYGTDTATTTKLYASTYYVYDDLQRLAVVLSPEGVKAIVPSAN
ncbi:MAG TPA: DUF6443 domain-containing protein [Cyclobacteriaceae bacterium]